MLEREYDRLKEIGDDYLRSATCYSITSDGWSNIKGQHMVNFIVHVPNQKPFFLKKVSTVGIPQTSISIAAEIIKVIEELGPDKCVGVVTDNASNMQGAWKIIEEKYSKIYCNGCASHVMNLLIRDICESDIWKDIMASIQKVCLFVKSRYYLVMRH